MCVCKGWRLKRFGCGSYADIFLEGLDFVELRAGLYTLEVAAGLVDPHKLLPMHSCKERIRRCHVFLQCSLTPEEVIPANFIISVFGFLVCNSAKKLSLVSNADKAFDGC